MDTRPGPQHSQYTARQRRFQVLSTVIVGFLVVWLYVYTPSFLVPYRIWLWLVVSFIDLAFALWFIAGSIFFHTRFARIIGIGPTSPMVPRLGIQGTRLFFMCVGVFLLIVGIAGLIGWFN